MGVIVGGVGKAIRDRRNYLGINQKELGRRAGGLTQDYISKLENGIIGLPQRTTMDSLATALDIPVSVLYRAAGILDGVEPAPLPADAMPPAVPPEVPTGDRPYDPESLCRFVEAHPDPQFRADLAELKAAYPGDQYIQICRSIARAWLSNGEMAIKVAREIGGL